MRLAAAERLREAREHDQVCADETAWNCEKLAADASHARVVEMTTALGETIVEALRVQAEVTVKAITGALQAVSDVHHAKPRSCPELCAFCNMTLAPGAPGTATLACGHQFHFAESLGCSGLLRWINTRHSCPTCQQ